METPSYSSVLKGVNTVPKLNGQRSGNGLKAPTSENGSTTPISDHGSANVFFKWGIEAWEKQLIDQFVKQYKDTEITFFRAMTSKIMEICRVELSQVGGSFGGNRIKFALFDRELSGTGANPRENGKEATYTGSAKDPESMEKSLMRRRMGREGGPFTTKDDIQSTMYDLSAMTIALYYPHDMEKVDGFIKKRFHVQCKKEWPPPKGGGVSYPILGEERMFSGYVGRHYIVKLHDNDTHLPQSQHALRGKLAEIQVKSLVMFAWQKVHHELVYKADVNMLPTHADDERMIDLSNGVIQAGEIALKQLGINYDNRQKRLDIPLDTPNQMTAFLQNTHIPDPSVAKAHMDWEDYSKKELFMAIKNVHGSVTPRILNRLRGLTMWTHENRASFMASLIMNLEMSSTAMAKTLALHPHYGDNSTSARYIRARHSLSIVCQTLRHGMALDRVFEGEGGVEKDASQLFRNFFASMMPQKKPKLEHVLSLLHPRTSHGQAVLEVPPEQLKVIEDICSNFRYNCRHVGDRDTRLVVGEAYALAKLNIFATSRRSTAVSQAIVIRGNGEIIVNHYGPTIVPGTDENICVPGVLRWLLDHGGFTGTYDYSQGFFKAVEDGQGGSPGRWWVYTTERQRLQPTQVDFQEWKNYIYRIDKVQ